MQQKTNSLIEKKGSGDRIRHMAYASVVEEDR